MKNVIIGTAGHVDHGKTTLVKVLTGIDTDRLEEEKRRGVTIEPGFAYLDFDDGSCAGIIDVPGRERFIRNMLAGSGGVDLAMLVIAADEGVMPQTREHLGILSQLGIVNGLVVITKSDKAEPDWLELVIEDISALVKGTFLESKEMITVSSVTGVGISELKGKLHDLLKNSTEKNMDKPFRLPIDRVFPVDGFGIVVTGTLIEGSVKVGDTAEILPAGDKAPVRNVQVHGENASTAYAGQRTAISLAGVKRGTVQRGDVLTAVGMLNITNAIDVKLNVLPDCERKIKNGAEFHLYHGARTMLVKAFLIDKNEIGKSEGCYARLKLKEPLPCKRGDRFVLRFFSPLETIGGGIILDSMPSKKLSRTDSAIEALKIREQGNEKEIASLAAYELGGVFSEMDLCKRADFDNNTGKEVIEVLVTNKKIILLSGDKYISNRVLDSLSKECNEILSEYHKVYPLRAGMSLAELRQKLMPLAETAESNAVFNALNDKKTLVLSGSTAALPGFGMSYSEAQQKIHKKLKSELIAAKYDVKSPDELAALFAKGEKRDFNQVIESMISSGEIIKLSQQIYWYNENYLKAIDLTKKHFSNFDEITLAQCRDMLGTSRKYALAFLEYLDAKKVTKMQGDSRKLAGEAGGQVQCFTSISPPKRF